MGIKIGVRWDDEKQNRRFIEAKKLGLIDFIEVNYPLATNERPMDVGLPIYAHSANNALCSAYGLNESLVEIIKNEAIKYNSPWIGEHLAWLGINEKGALGYVFNPIYNEEFFNITIANIEKLKKQYNRPIALELGPQYVLKGDFKDEIDFLISAAQSTNSGIILDLSHLMISNNNLGRKLDYGIERFQKANTVEVHVSGIRKSENSKFWHDCHDNLPDDKCLEILSSFCNENKTLKAVTFEHTPEASREDFMKGLQNIRGRVFRG
jgi:uncharacterized protein (UPF0276 family)